MFEEQPKKKKKLAIVSNVTVTSGGGGTREHNKLRNLDFESSGHIGFASENALNEHINNIQNPHNITKEQLGLPENIYSQDEVDFLLSTKVDGREGYDLSENDFTNELLDKLRALENYNDEEIRELIRQVEDRMTTSDSNYTTYQDLLNAIIKNDANIEAIVDNKADKTELFSRNYDDLSNKPTIPSKVVDLDDAANYALKTELFSKNYEELDNKPTIPSTTEELTNNSGFITNAIDDLVNYYKKSETYTQDEIKALISALPKFSIKVVDELPTENISKTTIYLKRSEKGIEKNIFSEYIYVDGWWEKLGEQSIELDGYATEEWVNNQWFLTEHQDLSGYYTKTETDELLKNIEVDLTGYATEQWVEDKNYLTEHQSLEGYATEQWVEDKKYLTEHQSLEGYATEEWVNGQDFATKTWVNGQNFLTEEDNPTRTSELTNDGEGTGSKFATIKEVEDILSQATGGESAGDVLVALNDHKENFNNPHKVTAAQVGAYTTDEVDGKVSLLQTNLNLLEETKANKEDMFSGSYNDLSDKPTIPTKTSELTNDKGFITAADVPDVDFTGYAKESWVEEKGYLTSDDISNKADKSELFSRDYNDLLNKPTIPSKTSQLTNDSGFITANDIPDVDLTGYAKETYVNQKVADLVNSAPETLDTLGELATAIKNHEDEYDALLEVVGNKADKSELFSKDYNDLTNKPTIPADFVVIELSSIDTTLTESEFAFVEQNPYKVIFTYADRYYYFSYKSSDVYRYGDSCVHERIGYKVQNNQMTNERASEGVAQYYFEITISTRNIKQKMFSLDAYLSNLYIQQNGTQIGYFSANSSIDKTINITTPTKVSELTNDSGFKTTDNNTTYTLTKSGNIITLTGSDGSTTSVTDTDTNTTYKAGSGINIASDGTISVSFANGDGGSY